MIAYILAAAGLAAAVALPQTFTLECEGQEWRSIDAAPEPASFSIRVDLATMRHCYNDCPQIAPIQEARPDLIVFLDTYGRTARGTLSYRRIDRTTGRYEALVVDPHPAARAYIRTEAICTAAPFIPFPEPKF